MCDGYRGGDTMNWVLSSLAHIGSHLREISWRLCAGMTLNAAVGLPRVSSRANTCHNYWNGHLSSPMFFPNRTLITHWNYTDTVVIQHPFHSFYMFLYNIYTCNYQNIFITWPQLCLCCRRSGASSMISWPPAMPWLHLSPRLWPRWSLKWRCVHFDGQQRPGTGLGLQLL